MGGKKYVFVPMLTIIASLASIAYYFSVMRNADLPVPLAVGVTVSVPPFDQWAPDTQHGVRVLKRQGVFEVTGNNTQSGYQLVSPSIPVNGQQTVTLNVDYITTQGRVCPGVLDGKLNTWIVAPEQPRNEIVFVSGSDKSSVVVIMANCHEKAIGNPASRFILHSAKFKTETRYKNDAKILSQQEIASTIGISEKAPRLEIINAARDFVYRNAGNNPIPQTNTSSEDLYLLAVKNKLPRSCGRMARTYQYVLQRLGISSRRVDLYAKTYMQGDNIYDTHYTVEVELDKGRFIASDPTFNASFRCEDIAGPSSYQELYECVKEGRTVVSLPGQQLPHMGVNDYYIPYHNLFAGVLVYAKGEEGGVIAEFPQGWVRNRAEIMKKKASQSDVSR